MARVVLEIEALKKTFRSPDGEVVPVLDVASFSLRDEEQAALAGESGSGKTTLLHVIAGILTCDAGSVRVCGEDVTRMSEPERDRFRARHVGYVFQSFHLLPGYTSLENVVLGMTFGPGPDRAYAESLLVRLGMKDRLHHRPTQLSIGQQQRVAVARALANRPRLVLADEPTGNLDAARADEALTLIQDVCRERGAALLLVSHDPRALARFDRCVDLLDINRAARRATEGTA